MSDDVALKRVNTIDDEANGSFTVEEIANFDARLKREMANTTEAVRKMFSEALEGPQQQVQFTQKTYDTIMLVIAASMAQLSARLFLAMDRRRSLEKRVERLESGSSGPKGAA